MILLIVTVTVSLSISFLCSLFEACLLSTSLADIARIQEKRPAAARIWLGFKKSIDRPIAVILIINTLAHTIGASLSGAMFETMFSSQWIIVFSLAYSFFMIQFTEILPKSLGVKYNKGLASVSAVPLKILIYIFTPFVVVVHAVNRLFSGKKKTDEKMDVVGEISVLAHFAQSSEQISKDQERILTQALKLSKITIRDIMVKKSDIKFLSTRMSLSEALVAAHLHHHTRFPLVDGERPDEVIGYINFKDIVTALRINPADPTLRGIMRPIISLSADETISNGLSRLTSGYQHIALVKNSDGAVIGLVTLENILESIVGDVKDEYDILPTHCYRLSETRVLAGGGIRISELNRQTGLQLAGGEEILNDWLLAKFGKVPAPDEEVVQEDLVFQVRKVSRSKIYEAVIDRAVT